MKYATQISTINRVLAISFLTILLTACKFEFVDSLDTGTTSQSSTSETSNVASDTSNVASDTSNAVPVTVSSKGTATLNWMPPTTRADGSALTNLAGYKIYYGLTEQTMTTVIDINTAGLTSYVIENLDPNTYYFAITAYDAEASESSHSNVASAKI